jgi:chloride channel 7
MEEEQSPRLARDPATEPSPAPEWPDSDSKNDDSANDPEDPAGGSGSGSGNGISSLEQPLLKRSTTLTASHLAIVGAKVSHIESLDYE